LKRCSAQILLILLILPRLVFPASSLSDSLWIVGYAAAPVQEAVYNTEHYLQFTMVVGDTNRSDLIGVGIPVTVICPTDLGNLTAQNYYNLSGSVNDVQVDEIPAGFFIASSVQTSGTTADLTAIIKLVVQVFGLVSRGIAATVAQLIAIFTGVVVPEWVITLALAVFLFSTLIKYASKIGIVMVVILIFLVVSGSANLLSMMWA
jgi:hypothetical protein